MEHTKIHGRQSKFILRVANDRPRGRRKAPNRRMEGSGKGTALAPSVMGAVGNIFKILHANLYTFWCFFGVVRLFFCEGLGDIFY